MSQDSLIKMPFPCVVCDQEVRPRQHAAGWHNQLNKKATAQGVGIS